MREPFGSLYMKLMQVSFLALGLLLGAQAMAATAQQERMTSCNAEAKTKTLSGDDRKAFMSTCLKSNPAAASTQQEKMKICNKNATEKTLKGDERKTFMSNCLKK